MTNIGTYFLTCKTMTNITTFFTRKKQTEESGPLAGMEISYDVEVMQSLKRNGSKPSVFY
jgi:hypothetical protein